MRELGHHEACPVTLHRVSLRGVAVGTLLALAYVPAWSQAGRLHVAAQGGYTLGIDDNPAHAIVRGASVSLSVSKHWRIGVEYLDADMFGPYENYESHAELVTPVFEYQFAASRRLKPFASFGLGYTKWRSLIPEFRGGDPEQEVWEWDEQRGINLAGGFGLRIFLTKRLFVAPEVRIGLLPILRSTVSVGYAFL